MPLAPATRLGRYEIRSLLGAGGMGEVYLARDPKLSRDVAIKVLPAEFSSDAGRLRRFEQEAQSVGRLNHPNVLAVFDVDTRGGAPYVVYELLEGGTLREQLSGAALPQRKALDYALQIARGLAAAHERGIVHRDLKPENLFVTKDGRIKILDFGLAKLTRADAGLLQSDAPTRRVDTEPGAVVGTAGYMSPEQVRGQKVDHRTDIFSFGCVLYEILSGRKAFKGETAVETLNAILKEDPPDLTKTNGQISPALERVVRHCLEKSPDERFRSAHDLAFALEALAAPSGSQATAAIPPAVTERAPRRWLNRERLIWLAATALLALTALGVAWAYFKRRPGTDTRVVKLSIMPPENASFNDAAVSPDGRLLAFTAATGARVQLWVRALDSTEARALAGTEGATFPFWSPDSRFIGFFAAGKLKKVEVTGGLPATLCDAGVTTGGAWSRDGVILFAALGGGGLFRVPAAGGEASLVKRPDWKRQETDYAQPYFLPDGRHFLYSKISEQKEVRGIHLGSLDGGVDRRLLGDDSNAVYAASGTDRGYLLFAREGALMAHPFDARQPQLKGEPFPVAAQVGKVLGGPTISRRRNFSASDNGVLVFDPLPDRQRSQLVWVDRGGRRTVSLDGVDNVITLSLSPDEKRLVVTRSDSQMASNDLWLSDVTGAGVTRFTFDPAIDNYPVWSPDGSRIAWSSSREGVYNLYQKAASGAGQDELLLESEYFKFPSDWSRDGRFIIYRQIDPKTKWDVWVLPVGPLAGDQKPFPFLRTEANETAAVLSPGGQWMAYSSDESGRYEVYVQSFPGGGGKRQVSTAGGLGPHWRGDGRELYYHAPDGKLMAAAVKGDGSTFEAGPPAALFEFRAAGSSIAPFYSVTADGQRFLLSTIVVTEAAAPLTVVVNWVGASER